MSVLFDIQSFFNKVFNSQIRVSFTALNICHFTVQNFHTFLLYNNDDIQFFCQRRASKKMFEEYFRRVLEIWVKTEI